MFNVCCVLKSGGVYDASWVEKLERGVKRHLKIPHRFYCLSDVAVPCERVELEHDWPGWFSKIELFKPGVITGDTLYLDLDTVITGDLTPFTNLPNDFAMLRNFTYPEMVGSGVMWFRKVPHQVYTKFAKMPECYIAHHERMANVETCYIGDQAFIHDALDRKVDTLDRLPIRSYRYHCRYRLLPDTSLVCFHGRPRPPEVKSDWMREHWA
jgi:hypothetical protein